MLFHQPQLLEKNVLFSKNEMIGHYNRPQWLVDGLSGWISGLVIETLCYGHDSAKIFRQSGRTFPPLRYNSPLSFASTAAPYYRGFWPVLFTGTGPAFALFFSSYSLCKDYLGNWVDHRNRVNGWGLSESTVDSIVSSSAAMAAAPLSSILAVPSDVIKKRMILQQPPTPFFTSMSQLLRSHGWKGLFQGYQANLTKDLPVAVLKMATYEVICGICYRMRKSSWYPEFLKDPSQNLSSPIPVKTEKYEGMVSSLLTSREAAICGFSSALITAIATMPLDVVNTHLKNPNADPTTTSSMRAAAKYLYGEGGMKRLYRGTKMRTLTFTVSATIFWVAFNKLQRFLQETDMLAVRKL